MTDYWRSLGLDDLLPILAQHGVTRFALGELVIERTPAPVHAPAETPPPAAASRDAIDVALDGPPVFDGDGEDGA